MADQAKVTSIDALESFRATLVRYLERARRSLDDVGGEVRRTRTWLDGDRRMHWDQQAKIRARKLAQAEQELYSVRLTDTHGVHALQKMMVLKARRAFDEAEEKQRVIKQWHRKFDQSVEPMLKRLESTQELVSLHLPLALASLDGSIRLLESYAEAHAPAPQPTPAGGAPPPAPPAEGENPDPPDPAPPKP